MTGADSVGFADLNKIVVLFKFDSFNQQKSIVTSTSKVYMNAFTKVIIYLKLLFPYYHNWTFSLLYAVYKNFHHKPDVGQNIKPNQ